MSTLHPPPSEVSTQQKAAYDAHKVQTSIEEECAASGRSPPPYMLDELIGKGTFGRVYKATSNSGHSVAVKVISIEEGDILDPKRSDTFGDIMKEVNTLKLLGTRGARNVNLVIDAMLFEQTIWVVTELCAGGSLSTLMRPTGGLPEKWIIPVLREVAVAIYWVHRQGIIHRDIKCANVLVTDGGQVQLCDFGVAGIIESKFDKRSTVIGTLQWMPPELFDVNVSYGTEVDIWAFGSMAYEVATGLPPNANTAIDPTKFGTYLKQHVPRLEGDQYSHRLKDLVAYCMVNDPKKRPPIGLVQMHPYIYDTEQDYPTTSLMKLVCAYRIWESQGGIRHSLFADGGAQGQLSDERPRRYEEWDFNADDSAHPPLDNTETQAVCDVYGSSVNLPAQPQAQQPVSQRRRKPPPSLLAFKAPLEMAFDPNTILNYHEHVRDFYDKQTPITLSDLPLRDDNQQPYLKESLIDLNASLKRVSRKAPQIDDLETIRPAGKSPSSPFVNALEKTLHKFRKVGDRRTQDWTFSVMSPKSPEIDHSRFVPNDRENPRSRAQQQGEPTPRKSNATLLLSAPDNRVSTVSLIDLDASLTPLTTAHGARQSAAGSDDGSVSPDTTRTPFEFERQASTIAPFPTRESSLYLSVQQPYSPPGLAQTTKPRRSRYHGSGSNVGVYKSLPPVPPPEAPLPPLPLGPASKVLEGLGSKEDLKGELHRMIGSMNEHLKFASGVLETLPEGNEDAQRGNGVSGV